MRPRAALASALLLLVAAGGCNEKKRQHRTGDAPPVVVVHTPSPPPGDGGMAGQGGSHGDELEPNDGADTATPIALGQHMRGMIDPDGDADYYRLDITEPASLQVALPAVDADLSVDLLDGSLDVVARSDRPGKRIEEGFPNFGVVPGSYLLVVRGKKTPPPKTKKKQGKGKALVVDAAPAAPPGVAYDLLASAAPVPPNGEREPNDDRGTAAELIVGAGVSGYLGWDKDVDVWKLSVEALGVGNVVDIEVGAIDGVALTVEIADALGESVATRRATKGSTLVVPNLTLAVAAGAPPFFYVTVKGDRSNPTAPYTLKVTEQPAPDGVDVEPNDTLATAMEIPADRTQIMAAWSGGDVDYFAVPPTAAARTVAITVETQDAADFALELFVDGKVIAKVDTPGKGKPETVSGVVPAGAKAVVRVTAAASSSAAAYSIAVHDGPAPP